MNHFVYILRSEHNPNYLYKGYTTDLRQRLIRHDAAKTGYTSRYKPWKLIFYCVFSNKKKALNFEKYLKTASGIAFMRKRLIDFKHLPG